MLSSQMGADADAWCDGQRILRPSADDRHLVIGVFSSVCGTDIFARLA